MFPQIICQKVIILMKRFPFDSKLTWKQKCQQKIESLKIRDKIKLISTTFLISYHLTRLPNSH